MQDTRSLPHLHLAGCHFYALAAIEFNKFRLGLTAILTSGNIFSALRHSDPARPLRLFIAGVINSDRHFN